MVKLKDVLFFMLRFALQRIIDLAVVIVVLIMVASLCMNMYFILGKGIIQDNRTMIYNSQGQSQGTLIENNNLILSGTMEWQDMKVKTADLKQALNDLNTQSRRAFIIDESFWDWIKGNKTIIYLKTDGNKKKE